MDLHGLRDSEKVVQLCLHDLAGHAVNGNCVLWLIGITIDILSVSIVPRECFTSFRSVSIMTASLEQIETLQRIGKMRRVDKKSSRK